MKIILTGFYFIPNSTYNIYRYEFKFNGCFDNGTIFVIDSPKWITEYLGKEWDFDEFIEFYKLNINYAKYI